MAVDTARHVFDPSRNVLFEKITYCESAADAIEGSDALFVSTDWDEFRGLSATVEKAVSPPYLIIDGRRMIPDFEDLVSKGYTYMAVGSMVMKP